MADLVMTRVNPLLQRGWRRYVGALVPLFVLLAVLKEPSKLSKVTIIIVALLLAGLVSKYPTYAVAGLISFLPLQQFIFSFAFKYGVTGGLLHRAQAWKEVVIAGLIIAAWRSHRAHPRKLDWLDFAGLFYLACVGAYYVLPHLFTFGTPIQVHAARYAAFRDDTEYVVAFFAARHAGLDRTSLRPIARWVLIVGTIVAVGGIYEHLNPTGWSNFVVKTVHLPQYHDQVLHSPLRSAEILDYETGRLRVGSVLNNPIVLGPFLLISFGVAMERIARRAANVWVFLAAAAAGGAVIFSGTRSSVIGLILIPILALRPAPGRTVVSRIRLGLVVLLLLVVAAPIASSSGLVNRTLSAISGKDSSANSHRTKFHQGVHEMAVHPLGAGLGTVGGVGQSLDPFGGVTAEDYYLQVGDELGIHTLVGFALLTVLLLVALRRSIDGSPGMAASGGAWLGGVALAVGAFLLHVWAGLVISLCFWTFAGAVIGIADIRRLEDAVRTTASALPAPSARRRELARG